jgi:hypothetical protein
MRTVSGGSKEIRSDIARADYCTFDVRSDGNASLYLFWDDRETPFAVAHLGPSAVAMLMRELVRHLAPEGHA